MKWHKLGRIFNSDGNYPWMKTHASNTVAEYLEGDIFRIYFSCRNVNSVSSIAFVDVQITPSIKLLKVAEEPILTAGDLGTFDDSGTSLACIVNVNNKKFLYYLGWNLGVTVPWRNSIGLAIYSEGSGSYEKYSKAPILDRCHVDPYSISYPFILKDEKIYRMWYGSNLSWGREQKDMAHVIKYAESHDGINWERTGRIALPFKNEDEYAMSRPFVIKECDKYKMWYSYRGKSYRIGYAESTNGLDWQRLDEEVGISVSESGWDSEMLEYPFIFDHKGNRYMLYNGNGYGRTGFGLAIME